VSGPDLGYFHTLSGEGAALSGTGFHLYARKTTKGSTFVAEETEQHIKFTATTGIVVPRSSGGSHPGAALSFDVLPRRKDADTANLIISTGSAISYS